MSKVDFKSQKISEESNKRIKEPWLYETDFYKPGKWDVSHFNFSKTVKERIPNLPKTVLPTDTTLREGVEHAGVHLSVEDYLEVAVRLAEVGVKEADIGYAAHPEPLKVVQRVTEAGVNISKRLIVRFAAKEEQRKQIDDAVEAGVNVIKLQTGTGRLWKARVTRPEYYKLWKTNQVIPHQVEAIEYILEEHPHVFIQLGMTGTSHADIELLKDASKAAVDAGAHRISCSESMGVANPHAMQYFAEEIRSVIGNADLQCHCHNDFGLATSNTISWVAGGGTSFDGTINGLGDRAGNASLEECVFGLEVLYGVKTGIKLEMLTDLCTWFEDLSGIKMSHTKAITGPGQFLEESHMPGYFTREKIGSTDDWGLPYAPAVVGRKARCVWGSTNLFPWVIRQKLDLMGLSATDQEVEAIRKKGWEIIDAKKAKDGSGECFIEVDDFEKVMRDILKK